MQLRGRYGISTKNGIDSQYLERKDLDYIVEVFSRILE
jgi:hypothetical protein